MHSPTAALQRLSGICGFSSAWRTASFISAQFPGGDRRYRRPCNGAARSEPTSAQTFPFKSAQNSSGAMRSAFPLKSGSTAARANKSRDQVFSFVRASLGKSFAAFAPQFPARTGRDGIVYPYQLPCIHQRGGLRKAAVLSRYEVLSAWQDYPASTLRDCRQSRPAFSDQSGARRGSPPSKAHC